MTRKCHNHTLQTNHLHCEEETQKNKSHMASKGNYCKVTSSPFTSLMIGKLETTLSTAQ